MSFFERFRTIPTSSTARLSYGSKVIEIDGHGTDMLEDVADIISDTGVLELTVLGDDARESAWYVRRTEPSELLVASEASPRSDAWGLIRYHASRVRGQGFEDTVRDEWQRQRNLPFHEDLGALRESHTDVVEADWIHLPEHAMYYASVFDTIARHAAQRTGRRIDRTSVRYGTLELASQPLSTPIQASRR